MAGNRWMHERGSEQQAEQWSGVSHAWLSQSQAGQVPFTGHWVEAFRGGSGHSKTMGCSSVTLDVLVNCLMLLSSPWRKFQAQFWCWAGVSICLIIYQLIHQSAHFCAFFISKPEDPFVICRKGQVQGFSRPDIAIFFQYCTLVGL